MNESIGLLEVSSMTAAIACIDAMSKGAYVELSTSEKLGNGMITLIIRGELAAIKEALIIGERTAAHTGQLLTSSVIARPYVNIDKHILKRR